MLTFDSQRGQVLLANGSTPTHCVRRDSAARPGGGESDRHGFMVHSCCMLLPIQPIGNIKLRPVQTSFGVHLDFIYFE